MADTITPPPGFQIVGEGAPPPPPGFELQPSTPVSEPVQPDVNKANTGLAKSIAGSLQRTVQGVEDIATVYGPIEAALNATSGMIFGFPMYLGAGVGTLAARGLGLTDADPKEVASEFASAVTYHAQTQAGQRLSNAVTLPLTALNDMAEKAGHKVTDVTGSAGAGALTEATIQMLPAPIISSLARRLGGDIPTKEATDSTAKVATGDQSGAVARKMTNIYEKTGVDPQAVADAAKTDPTIVQDLAASNREIPKGLGIKEAEKPAAVESTKPPEPPKAAEAIKEISSSEAEKSILSRIVTDVPKTGKTVAQYAHHLYTEYIDRYHPIAQAEAGRRQSFPEGVGPYEAQRLTAGVAGKAKRWIEFGGVDPETFQTNSPSYMAALDMAKSDPKGFEAYIVAKHALEREANGKATGIDLNAAKSVVENAPANIVKAGEMRVKFMDSLINYVRDHGQLLTPESVDAMREAYKAHVPFQRLFEGEDVAQAVGGKTPRTPVKRATGSERLILDPIATDIKNIYTFLSLAEHNAARLKMLELGPDFIQKVKKPMKPIGITSDEVTKALKNQGIDLEAEGFTAFRPQSYNAGKGEIVIFENGKRGVYKVDPEVARAFNGLDASSSSLLSGMLRSTASWLRAGVTLSPDFAMRNMIRDAASSFVYAGSHPIKTLRGLRSYWKQDEAYQNWLQGGGANAAIVSIDRQYIERHLYELEPQTHLMEHTWNVVKTPIEALRIMSETMENVTRLGIKVDELKQAKTKAQIQALSLMTREGTVDFARHGADPFLQQWSRATAFMNPAIQGIDKMVRAFKDNPAGVSAKAFASITIPSLLLWWVNHDDPRYKDMQDWERDLFWNIFTDKWELPKNGADFSSHHALGLTKEIDGKWYVNNGHTFRIPKPFEVGVLFGSLPERIMDAYVADKPDAFKNFGRTIGNIFGFNVIPTALLPPLQQATNYNFFTDRPLVPDSMKNIVPEYQYMPYTTELTKKIAGIVGAVPGLHMSEIASPVVIDNYIRGWTGTLGTYAMQLADLGLRKTGVLPDPLKPAMKLEDMPVIRAFMVRYPSAGAQSIQDFYDNYTESQKVVSTVKLLAQRGDIEAMTREMNMDQSKLVKLDGIKAALSNAQKVIQMIDQNQKINPDEKRQLIDTIYMQMIAMSHAGNDETQQIKNALGQKTIH